MHGSGIARQDLQAGLVTLRQLEAAHGGASANPGRDSFMARIVVMTAADYLREEDSGNDLLRGAHRTRALGRLALLPRVGRLDLAGNKGVAV